MHKLGIGLRGGLNARAEADYRNDGRRALAAAEFTWRPLGGAKARAVAEYGWRGASGREILRRAASSQLLAGPAATLKTAFLLDLVGRELPESLHPVCWMGKAVDLAERLVPGREGSAAAQKAAGTLVAVLLPAGTYLAASAALRLMPKPLRGISEAALLSTALAGRSLYSAARDVDRALAEGLPAGRSAVSRLVGRDTDVLDEEGVVRAAVESVAENANDGVVAPVFYALIGGAPLALAYKMVNTLDSMIGYKSLRYRDFGWAAARLDDVAGYVPARLTALAAALAAPLAGGSPARAVKVWRQDAGGHVSPNAGVCEAAFAGALGVTLGGADTYQGVRVEKRRLGAGMAGTRKPERRDILRAARLMCGAAALVVATGSVVRRLAARVGKR